jgi:hypothetical protein
MYLEAFEIPNPEQLLMQPQQGPSPEQQQMEMEMQLKNQEHQNKMDMVRRQ